MKQTAVIYANQYGYFDMENTLNDLEAAYHAPDCDENRKARMSAYRRAKRQLTSCQFPATKQLFESLKPQTGMEP